MEFISDLRLEGFDLKGILIFMLFAGDFTTGSNLRQPIVDARKAQLDLPFFGEPVLYLFGGFPLALRKPLVEGLLVC